MSSLAFAIQLTDSLVLWPLLSAAARLRRASLTARRTLAEGEWGAIGGRSPRAKATPAGLSKSFAMRAQSATGDLSGADHWSRAVRPPTVRSPRVMRKRLLATVG